MIDITSNKHSDHKSKDVQFVWTNEASGAFKLVRQGSQEIILAEGVYPKTSTDAKVELFDGKGGMGLVVKTPTNRYLIMPGSQFTKGDLAIKMHGELPSASPAPKVELPKMSPKQSITNVGMLLGAGLSSRFEPLPKLMNVAKPAALISHEDSLISRLAKQFKSSGIDHVLVNTFFMPETTAATLDKAGKKHDINLHYIEEAPNGAPSGSAGGLTLALNDPKLAKLLEGQHVVVSAGDSILHADIPKLIENHVKNHAAMTLGAFRASENALDKYGIIVTDPDRQEAQSGVIKAFVEKPALQEGGMEKIGGSRLMNPSFYVISPEVLPIIKGIFNDPEYQARQKGKNVMNPGADWAMDILPRVMKASQAGELTRNGKPLSFRAEELSGHWRDVGNVPEYFRSLDDVYGGLFGEKPHNDGFYKDGIAYWDKDAAINVEKEGVTLKGNAVVASHAMNE